MMIWLPSTRWFGNRKKAATGSSQNAISSARQRSVGSRGTMAGGGLRRPAHPP